MINVIISGALGHMGRTVAAMVAERGDMQVAAGIDIAPLSPADALQIQFPVFAALNDVNVSADVIIDFTSPSAIEDGLLDFAISRNLALVLCTTGYTADDLDKIRAASQKIPVFRSGNMSLGINLLLELAKRATAVLGGGFDVEIVERHHRRKVDAPSGTAVMLADAVADAMGTSPEYIYDRHSRREARPANEIGLSAVRGGTIVGDHTVIFAGTDEVIELRHSAYSRDVFAVGAVNAARFMAGVNAPGMYDMSDVLAER